MSTLTPEAIVAALDSHIIGQSEAKRAVAIALRNRWRRAQIPSPLRDEITPKNILMIGPTGVGKTEIARRLARLAEAPFIKVEATKFTEVGYVGRDVESIIRDLAEAAYKRTRALEMMKVKAEALKQAERRILDALLPGRPEEPQGDTSPARIKLRERLLQGDLDDKEVEIETSAHPVGVEIMAPPGMEEMSQQLQGLFQNLQSGRTRTRRLRVRDALKTLEEEESARLINEEDIKLRALESAEQHGIVFIDEIDKICKRPDMSGADISREGVQRDLLPLVEGSTVTTKYGPVHTDHILFIASGAFHLTKPSDLIPELQGRFPIRVELTPLDTTAFIRILTEPEASLTVQYQALLKTEGVELEFTEDGIARIAAISAEVNERTENIGARRLHTVLERLLEPIAFDAPMGGAKVLRIDGAYVDAQLNDLARDVDLSRYIL